MDTPSVKQVWASNLIAEFQLMLDVVDDQDYIAFDTEFAGLPGRGQTGFGTRPTYEYLKELVRGSKLIQLGLTVSDANGVAKFVFEYNFSGFDPAVDQHGSRSVEMLKSSGLDLQKINAEGVDPLLFGELLMQSKLVRNDKITWLVFAGAFDFGYLISMLTQREELPEAAEDFLDIVSGFFPSFYDLKTLLIYTNNLHGGLKNVADGVGASRAVGTAHHAGSDSHLTSVTFFRMKEIIFKGSVNPNWRGVIASLVRGQ